jgi:hypothetical protein
MGKTTMHIKRFANEAVEAGSVASVLPGVEAPAAPWEEIESGRYMPRRIRGSYRGRELG